MPLEPELDRYSAIVSRIDTGSGDDATERALTVFHTGRSGDMPVSGWVTFPVLMPWRFGKPLPPIEVRHLLSGAEHAVQVTEARFSPFDNPNQAQRGILEFDLQWQVRPVLPGGWDTYIAAYGSLAKQQPTPFASDAPQANASDYVVAESLRHPGDLPPRMP